VCLTNHKSSCTSLCLTSFYVMWLWLVWIIYCKTNCSSGGTLGVHGRNPSEGSAISARPAEGLAINTKPYVWILALSLYIRFSHIHTFILSSNPLTSHFICEVSFVAKKFTSSYKVTSIQHNVARLVSLASCRLCIVYTSFDCVFLVVIG
jgi:hypothetical protein